MKLLFAVAVVIFAMGLGIGFLVGAITESRVRDLDGK